MRFGHDFDQQCMQMDEVKLEINFITMLSATNARVWASDYACIVQILAGAADQIKNFAVIYLVDLSEVPDFNTMYELYDPCTTMFFFRNKVGGTASPYQHASCCHLHDGRSVFFEPHCLILLCPWQGCFPQGQEIPAFSPLCCHICLCATAYYD